MALAGSDRGRVWVSVAMVMSWGPSLRFRATGMGFTPLFISPWFSSRREGSKGRQAIEYLHRPHFGPVLPVGSEVLLRDKGGNIQSHLRPK